MKPGVMTLNSKQVEEVNWWRNFIKPMGRAGFLDIRRQDWDVTVRYLPEILAATGRGLDLGCGPVSIFERSKISGEVYAVDALLSEYKKIILTENTKIENGPALHYLEDNGEKLSFGDNYFDWAMCRNVIDHTLNPGKMIAEIRRVLKLEGKLYFEVNFDQILGTAHYDLWNRDSVRRYFDGFRVAVERIQEKPEYRQQGFWAMLVNHKRKGAEVSLGGLLKRWVSRAFFEKTPV